MDIAAGSFGEWLLEMQGVLRGERIADVPCGECVGCCVSSYPIPLRPADQVAQALVPEQFLLHAPGLQAGHLLMGFREDGTCPMYTDHRCSIYADRPQTCRDYDCRIYAAAGILPAGERRLINERVAAWRFSYPDQQDRVAADAVRRAAGFIREHSERFPPPVRATSPTAVAVLALKTWPVFAACQDPECGEPAIDDADGIALRITQVLGAARAFDAAVTPAAAPKA